MSSNSGSSFERLHQQLEQPAAHDRSPLPGLEDPGHVVDEVGARLEQLVPLAECLHLRVLDAVVHHLRVVPRADRAGVDETFGTRSLGPQRIEDRHRAGDVALLAAGHQPVPVLDAPDAAGDAAVHEPDALLGEQRRVDRVVGEPGVAAVDDQVALPSTPARSVMTPVVIGPDGTITQTMRGAGSAATRPARSATSVTAGLGSYPVTSSRPCAGGRACCCPSCRDR